MTTTMPGANVKCTCRLPLLWITVATLAVSSVVTVRATITNANTMADDFATTSDNRCHVYELTQAKNLQRQERMQRECDSYNNGVGGMDDAGSVGYAQSINDIPDDQLEHLLVDEKHRFLYCYVPKVSNTFHNRWSKTNNHWPRPTIQLISLIIIHVAWHHRLRVPIGNDS